MVTATTAQTGSDTTAPEIMPAMGWWGISGGNLPARCR
jgi:hypothetical protein